MIILTTLIMKAYLIPLKIIVIKKKCNKFRRIQLIIIIIKLLKLEKKYLKNSLF